jgi:hypothetical protein
MLQAEREALMEQVDKLPDESQASVATLAKATRLMEQNMLLKEESAALVQEKAALMEQLKVHREAGQRRPMELPCLIVVVRDENRIIGKAAGEQSREEMHKVQQDMIAREEQRLEIGRALIDSQLQHNEDLQRAEEREYALKQRVLELEGQVAQNFLSAVLLCIQPRSDIRGS